MKVKEELNKLRETFMLFDNPKDKFVQLMDMAKQSQDLDISEKCDFNKINGCTSQAWVIVEPNNDGTYTIRADSDALIVKGLLTILEIISLFPIEQFIKGVFITLSTTNSWPYTKLSTITGSCPFSIKALTA